MEIDLETASGDLLSSAAPFEAEVCIIGGGIAGLTLAHRLSQLGADVLLLEAGGKAPASDEEVHSTDPARPFPGAMLDCGLGGTSWSWGGQLLPVASFEGWPLQAEELAPYWPQVEAIFGVDGLPYEAEGFLQALRDPLWERLPASQQLLSRFSKFAPFHRRNLGASLGRDLLRHPGTRVLLHAHVEEICLSNEGSRVRSVALRDPAGRRLQVLAAHFVVAAGTRASCRLLLASCSVQRHGAGNATGLLGCGFHEHISVELAVYQGRCRERALALGQPWLIGGLKGTVHSLKLELPGDQVRDGSYAMAHFTFEEPEGSGLAGIRHALQAGQRESTNPMLRNIGLFAQASGDLLRTYTAARRDQRRFLSAQATVRLRLNVAVGSRADACYDPVAGPSLPSEEGSPHFDINHDEVRATARKVLTQMTILGLGEEDGASWNEALLHEGAEAVFEDAHHAMGGAPMGQNPQHSVVTPELAVHGVSNLHVASAAVLPDGRAQLPTMTLIALSLRLADRLYRELRR